ncbi:hypothetical protein MMC18_007293 [Xylographa bjoerkii]|nr:hypothetical protein [Xylographa bjoerkii]
MVRIKHRYLLVHILSPNTSPPPSDPPTKACPPLPRIVQFRQPTPNELTPQLLLRAIREQVALLYGDYGAGVTAAGLNIKYLSPATSTFILRCPRAHYQLVWASLTYMTHLPVLKATNGKSFDKAQGTGPRPCVMRVVRVSGTIRKAEEEAVRRARADILRARRGVGGESSGLGGMFGSVLVGGEGMEDEGGIVDEEDGEEDEDEDDEEG